jgi:hypothetical protein
MIFSLDVLDSNHHKAYRVLRVFSQINGTGKIAARIFAPLWEH